jgi:hypothetical protein
VEIIASKIKGWKGFLTKLVKKKKKKKKKKKRVGGSCIGKVIILTMLTYILYKRMVKDIVIFNLYCLC